ncbi:hypothetical protein FGO68_gene4717 [Halteria grandinella]|uniref:MORN repeat protein n=1 Tax=Halteria grandinella TaxID=5974 RepID=A0A8J8NLJ0_HALGN|nr:hypothetical protein FGO68_gene4717 [Halteria grandinella]
MLNFGKAREWSYFDVEGLIYEGEVMAGTRIPYGRGMLVNKDFGIIYEGWFQRGVKHGYGRELRVDAGGYIYEGDFGYNEFEGYGKALWEQTGVRHEGNYSGNRRNGYGIFYMQGGNTYKGNFVNGFREGYGEQQFGPLVNYKGNFYQDQMHGYGLLSSHDLFYDGEFNMGKKHGFAKVWSVKSGNVFRGKFKEDQKHGFGLYKSDEDYYLVRNHVYNYRYYLKMMRCMLAYTFKRKAIS